MSGNEYAFEKIKLDCTFRTNGHKERITAGGLTFCDVCILRKGGECKESNCVQVQIGGKKSDKNPDKKKAR